ncbi:MAG TPA: N-methyl-L-tryptophan oxidase [Gemmatimonadaceae bacterium]|nr:N-methyl-L-tryptophan oxidase [Gemmatimonadaceae bacterium]
MRSSPHHDVIVAGLGAMGSATAAHLAMRGMRVLGLERWRPGHRNGSSHGDSRIIREMYFEHPMYVPLLKRAYDLWEELAERSRERLLHTTGGLMIGPENGALVSGTLRSAREHGLSHEVLSAGEVARRYPAFNLREDLLAVLDPRAGYLDPEACNLAHLETARQYGADLRFDETVLRWNAFDDGVTVTTACGSYSADHLVLAVGARTRDLLRGVDLPLEVERQAVFWLDPDIDSGSYDEPAFPIYAYEYEPREICYGFPRLPRGVKSSIMHGGEIIPDADEVERTVRDEEVDPLRRALAPILPGLARAAVSEREVCLFTNTPDHDFVIDLHPEHPQVVVSSACSGHGFKFASVIGEIQADLVMNKQTRFDMSPFGIGRLALQRKH